MKLSEKKLRELKTKKISVEDLYEKYFYTQQDGINIDIILKLLNENICSFKEIVRRSKSIKDKKNKSCLYKLLENKELFEELIKNTRLSTDDLRYLLNRVDKYDELFYLRENTILLKYIVDSVSFKDLVDKFKSMKDEDNVPCLWRLLDNTEFFEELIENNRLTQDDLRCLLNRIDDSNEVANLSSNTTLLKYTVDKNILSFKELVDTFESLKDPYNDPCLYMLLDNKEFFEELIQNNKVSKEDLRYLLNRIDRPIEFYDLYNNTPLVKHILNEFVLNKEDVDKFSRMIENDEWWFKEYSIHTIFEFIEYYNEDNEILKLNELNRKIHGFGLDEDQKLELAEILKNNKIAQNRLIQIIDTRLENNYSFDSLLSYLKKSEKKNLMNT